MRKTSKIHKVKNRGRIEVLSLGVIFACALSLCGCRGNGQSLEEMLAGEQALNQTQTESMTWGQTGETTQQGQGTTRPAGETTQPTRDISQNMDESTANAQGAQPRETEEPVETLWVHICGYVQTPGIYELPVDSRVYDCLMAAGGFAKGANETALNLADYLQDGSQIYVPGLAADAEANGTQETGAQGTIILGTNVPATNGPETGKTPGKTAGETDTEDSLININTASREQLESLPGIGESRAGDIIAYREANGPFQSIEDIQKISGIKSAIFAKIKDLITVGK